MHSGSASCQYVHSVTPSLFISVVKYMIIEEMMTPMERMISVMMWI